MDSLTQFVTEMWSLFGVAVAFTLFRGFARIKSVGLKGLQPDDHLAFVALVGHPGPSDISSS